MEKRSKISKGDEDNETISAEKKRFDGCVGRLHVVLSSARLAAEPPPLIVPVLFVQMRGGGLWRRHAHPERYQPTTIFFSDRPARIAVTLRHLSI